MSWLIRMKNKQRQKIKILKHSDSTHVYTMIPQVCILTCISHNGKTHTHNPHTLAHARTYAHIYTHVLDPPTPTPDTHACRETDRQTDKDRDKGWDIVMIQTSSFFFYFNIPAISNFVRWTGEWRSCIISTGQKSVHCCLQFCFPSFSFDDWSSIGLGAGSWTVCLVHHSIFRHHSQSFGQPSAVCRRHPTSKINSTKRRSKPYTWPAIMHRW